MTKTTLLGKATYEMEGEIKSFPDRKKAKGIHHQQDRIINAKETSVKRRGEENHEYE